MNKGIETVKVRVAAKTLIHQNTIHGLPMSLDIEQGFVAIVLRHQQGDTLSDALLLGLCIRLVYVTLLPPYAGRVGKGLRLCGGQIPHVLVDQLERLEKALKQAEDEAEEAFSEKPDDQASEA